MPFKEIYSVNFADGKLQPHVNLAGWPAMQFSQRTSNDHATRAGDSEGLKLRVIRETDDPDVSESRNIVFLAPPPFPVDIRLRMRLTFDLPRADNVPPGLHAQPGSVEPAEGGAAAPPGDMSQGAPVPSAPLDVPERWGVALSVSHSLETNILAKDMANVFCQFSQKKDGVRLLTPVQLQGDEAGRLDKPLDYDRYKGTPASSFPPALFTLEHTFCGYHFDKDKRAIGHTVGSGYLKIDHLTPLGVVLRDRRDYSSKSPLVPPLGPISDLQVPSIQSLRVTLLTATVGLVRARLRTFSLWFDPDAPQPVKQPVIS